jgi:KDO2-lipid IV(A) lauroyltransferase
MDTFNNIVFRLITFLLKTIGTIPGTWAVRLGHGLGNLWFSLDKTHRRITIDNLTIAFGREKTPGEIHELARRVFRHFGRSLFDVGWFLNLKERDFKKHIRIEGLSNYQRACAQNRGVLLLMAHIGNWELLPIPAAMVNMPAAVVYRPLDFEPLNRFFIQTRSRFGARMIDKNDGMRGILKNLRQGRCIAMLMDQRVNWTKSVLADFFGRKVYTHKSVALIALKTGAPVLPFFLIREQDGFAAIFGKAAPLLKTGDQAKDLDINTAHYNHIIEDMVRRYPEQWFWLHERWKVKEKHRTSGSFS